MYIGKRLKNSQSTPALHRSPYNNKNKKKHNNNRQLSSVRKEQERKLLSTFFPKRVSLASVLNSRPIQSAGSEKQVEIKSKLLGQSRSLTKLSKRAGMFIYILFLYKAYISNPLRNLVIMIVDEKLLCVLYMFFPLYLGTAGASPSRQERRGKDKNAMAKTVAVKEAFGERDIPSASAQFDKISVHSRDLASRHSNSSPSRQMTPNTLNNYNLKQARKQILAKERYEEQMLTFNAIKNRRLQTDTTSAASNSSSSATHAMPHLSSSKKGRLALMAKNSPAKFSSLNTRGDDLLSAMNRSQDVVWDTRPRSRLRERVPLVLAGMDAYSNLPETEKPLPEGKYMSQTGIAEDTIGLVLGLSLKSNTPEGNRALGLRPFKSAGTNFPSAGGGGGAPHGSRLHVPLLNTTSKKPRDRVNASTGAMRTMARRGSIPPSLMIDESSIISSSSEKSFQNNLQQSEAASGLLDLNNVESAFTLEKLENGPRPWSARTPAETTAPPSR